MMTCMLQVCMNAKMIHAKIIKQASLNNDEDQKVESKCNGGNATRAWCIENSTNERGELKQKKLDGHHKQARDAIRQK